MVWFRLDHSHLKQERENFWRLYYLNTASAYLHLRSIFNTGPQEGSNEVGGIEESILLFSHNALEVLRGMGLFSVSPIIIIGAEPSLMSHLFWICLITWLRSGKTWRWWACSVKFSDMSHNVLLYFVLYGVLSSIFTFLPIYYFNYCYLVFTQIMQLLCSCRSESNISIISSSFSYSLIPGILKGNKAEFEKIENWLNCQHWNALTNQSFLNQFSEEEGKEKLNIC